MKFVNENFVSPFIINKPGYSTYLEPRLSCRPGHSELLGYSPVGIHTMHSFTPSLSFLISILLVPLLRLSLFDTQSTSSGRTLSFAHAAELQNPHSNLTRSTSRDLVGHSNSLPSLRRHAELGHSPSIRRTDLNLHLGRRASNARFTYYVTGL